jgi:hypothetical protein
MDCNTEAQTSDVNKDPLLSPSGESSLTRKIVDDLSGAVYLHAGLPPEVINGLDRNMLGQWIDDIAEQFGMKDNTLGRMLITQMALVHHQVATLTKRLSEFDSEKVLPAWSTAITRLMAEFRRSFVALQKLSAANQNKGNSKRNSKAGTRQKAGSFLARKQLNAAN